MSLQPDLLRHSFRGVRLALVGPRYYPQLEEVLQPDLNSPTASPDVIVRPSRWSSLAKTRVVQLGLTALIAISVGAAVAITVPEVYYRVFPADTLPITAKEAGSPLGGEFAQGATPSVEPSPTPSPSPALPPQDLSLPEGRWLIIPRIGVRTELQETETEEEALAKGVWMVPDYGQPGDTEVPMILAAHRFGWQWWWQTDYWKYHSFYLLPETEPGDLIEIIADQRKYTYEIYAGEEGDEITDYDAHLILYTCKFLNSPVRHFRYARLVDWNANTQL